MKKIINDKTKLAERILTILFVAPCILAGIYIGDVAFLLFVTGIAIYCAIEFFSMASKQGVQGNIYIANFAIALIIYSAFANELKIIWGSTPYYLLITLNLLFFFSYETLLKRLRFARSAPFSTIRAIILFGWFFAYFILVRYLPQGMILTFYSVLLVWINDSMAYVVGRLIGHTPFNTISPNKTWEGAIGALLSAVIYSLIFNAYFHLFSWPLAIACGVIGSILAQWGDLYESLIKRTYQVKDSGDVLPGHGGIYDRMDSYIFLAPVFYYIFIIFVKP